MRRISLGKFVIPNPFGPLEEPRFTHYLAKKWFAKEVAIVNTPLYVRDNIHVSLLAKSYVHYVTSLVDGISYVPIRAAMLNPKGHSLGALLPKCESG